MKISTISSFPRPRRGIRCLVVVAIALGITGCDVMGVGCEPIGEYAVSVQVLDQSTGERVQEPTTLVIRDGAYVDSVRIESWGSRRSISAGREREGTYHVSVRSDGYAEWTQEDVRAGRRSQCGNLDAARLTAAVTRIATRS
jgi:hypothetical protein